jgi:hypothetical protein
MFGVLLTFGGVVVAAAGTHGSTNVIAALLVACAALNGTHRKNRSVRSRKAWHIQNVRKEK